MIQIEPTIKMATKTTTKTADMVFHSCSDEVFMCKKNTNCTNTCATAQTKMMATAGVPVTASVMTIPKGIAVNTMDRIKPTIYSFTLPWAAPPSWCVFADCR